MAFNLDSSQEEFDFITSKDEAVKCSKEQYTEYLKTLDESHLQLDDAIKPTRFVFKRTLEYEEQKKIKNSQLGFKDGDMQIRLGYMIEEVRYSMVRIDGAGTGMEFKKDSDGYVSKLLLQKLDGFGIIAEMHSALVTARDLKAIPPKKS